MIYRTIIGAVSGAVVASAITFGAEAAEVMIVDDAIPASLTGTAGDPANGKKVAINRKKGNCLACHVMPIPEEQFHGDVGPDLSDVGSNLSEGALRLRLVNSKAINPDTIMPAFLTPGKIRVKKNFEGKTILSAQEVEDVIAYLLTLKGQYSQ